MDDLVIKYISSLGFPIAMAMGMAWVLYRIGLRLTLAYETTLKDNTVEMRNQTAVLERIESTLPSICHAECRAESPQPVPARTTIRSKTV